MSAKTHAYDDPLIMSPVLQGYWQDDFVAVYPKGSSSYLPLHQFAYIVGITITRNGGSEVAGFMGEKSRTFQIDIEKGTAVFKNRRINFNSGEFELIDGHLTASADVLEQIFPLKIKIDPLSMSLNITSDEKLPNTLRLDAERKRESFGVTDQSKERWADYEFDDRTFGWPVIDVALHHNSSYRNYDSSSREGFHSQSYGVNVAALAFGLDNNLYMYSTKDEDFEPHFRFTTGRTYLRDEYSFPAVTTFRAGDINGIGSSYFVNNISGRGITASSFKDYVTSADKSITLSGPLLDGWEVELYLNGQLIGFRRSAEAGQYEFPSVPVVYGLNLFKLVFYGPYGETRTEEKRYYSGTSPVKTGQLGYTLNAYQPDRYLIENNEDFASKSDVPVVDLLSYYGVSDHFTAMAGFTHAQDAEDNEKARQFAMAGGQLLFKGASFQYNLEADLENQNFAHHAEVEGDVYIGNLFARYEHYGDIRSPISYRGDEYVKELAEGRLGGIIKPLYNTSYYVSVLREDFHSGKTNDTATVRLSRQFFTYYNLSVLDTWRSYGNQKDPSTNEISVLGQGRLGAAGLYFGAIQMTRPDNYLSELSAKADYRWNRYTYFSALWRRSMSAPGEDDSASRDTFTLSGSRMFSFGGLSAEASVDTKSNLSFGMHYNVSFGKKPGRTAFFANAKSRLSENGAAVFRLQDDAGAPIQDVLVRVNGVEIPSRTNENGEAVITDIQPYEKMIFKLDFSEAEDLSLMEEGVSYKYIMRPGTVRPLGAKFMHKGAVEGIIRNGGGSLLGYGVTAYNSEGEAAVKTFTDRQGTFVLDGVPYGEYEVEISKNGQASGPRQALLVTSPLTYFDYTLKGEYAQIQEADFTDSFAPPAPPAVKPDLKNIANYGFNGTTLNNAQKEIIRQKMAPLKNTAYSKILITGHTDNIGSYEVNKKVSLRRARAVAAVLAEEGFDPEKTEIAGLAYDNPVADNASKEGRQANRRTDVEVFD